MGRCVLASVRLKSYTGSPSPKTSSRVIKITAESFICPNSNCLPGSAMWESMRAE